ncbi:hypothetical protein F5888DRAFT_1165253 [Russula emetica]|nr:hypothetical protein F5888DRAFT_1165253 [Russula emetica]
MDFACPRLARVALRLLDPLNGADAANAARLSTTTVQSPGAVDQGQTATRDPLPEQALPLKRQAHTSEIEGDHATKRARSTASTPGTTTPRSPYSPTIEEVEDEGGPTPAPARLPQKQLTIIVSDEENEETESTGTDNAPRKGFSSGACLICLIQLKLNTID